MLLAATVSAVGMSGCAPEAIQVLQAAASASNAQGAGSNLASALAGGTAQPRNTNALAGRMMRSSASQKGFLQGQAIGAQMLANPVVVGVSALSMAQSRRNEAKNREAYVKLQNYMANADSHNAKVANAMVANYNRQMGTHYTTMRELQEAIKIEGYNKNEGTHFKTLSEVREDYNRKHGTNYQTDQAFREALFRR